MRLSDIKTILIIILFVTIGFGIYSNTLEAPFILDDNLRIQDNPNIRITELTLKEIGKAVFSKQFSKKRPIGTISFALNYYFHQYDLTGYHVVNIIIHILSGIFLYLFVKATLNLPVLRQKYDSPDLIAFFTALVWLVHPVHTQSVTYIIQRLNSMASMFFVLSLLLYVRGRISQEQNAAQNLFPFSSSILYFSGSVLSGILALGSKQTAATLPVVIIIYEWFFFQQLSRSWLRERVMVWGFSLLTFGLISLYFLGDSPIQYILSGYRVRDFTLLERQLTQFRVIIYYLSLLFYPNPSRLNLDHDFPLSHSLIDPISTLLCMCAIIGVIGMACYMAKKERLVSFCILWFFGNLVIESSIIPLEIIFEHRTYLPSMLIFLLAILLVSRYISSKWVKVSLVCAIVILSSFWTYQRNEVWSDEVALLKDCVKKSPNKARPHYNLGIALYNQGHTKEAINHFLQTLRIKPDHVGAHNNLGNALYNQGHTEEAISHYLQALRKKPDYAEAHSNLGVALFRKGDNKGAIASFREALRINPDYADLHFNLGVALDNQGHTEEAISHYLQALRIKPDYVEAQHNLSIALKRQGVTKEVINHYNLGDVLLKQGNTENALHQYQKALSIQPEFLPALNRLAYVHKIKEEYDEAISILKKMIEIQPNDAIAYYNISCIYSINNNIEESIGWLKKAVKKGYSNWGYIKTDKDLDNIRGSFYYKELIKDH